LCLCGSILIVLITALSGCGVKRSKSVRARLREEAKQIVKEQAPPADFQVSGMKWHVEDAAGRPVLAARVATVAGTVQPTNPSEGPVALKQADWTLFKEGKPSLWLKAPLATWQEGRLVATQGARCGTVDGKLGLEGKAVSWTARSGLLSVSTARCELREPSQPVMLTESPAASWQDGLLTLPSGARAHASDRSASVRADRVRWRPRTHGLEATGRVRMTRGRMAGRGERLIGDTTLRAFRLAGGRPHLTFFPEPAPLVAAGPIAGSGMPEQGIREQGRVAEAPASLASKWSPMAKRQSALSASGFPRVLPTLAGVSLLALPFPAPPAEARTQLRLPSSGVEVTADDINRDQAGVHATGNVIVTGSQGTLRADRVDVVPEEGSGKPGRAGPVRVVRASGSVRITSQPKPDERMEATGPLGTYWPGTKKAELTGGVTVRMTSPQLQEPAVLTGSRADIDLEKRSAEVVRTEPAQVALRLVPKPKPGAAGQAAAPMPVRLNADRVRWENATNQVTATGSPVMTGENSSVRAERISFLIDPQVNDVRTVHADGAVRIDSRNPEQGEFHATARQAVLNRGEETVVLTGNVDGKHTRPGETEPETFQTDELTYNFNTGGFHMRSAGEQKARLTARPKKK
jgi:lipopolysaccharide export system protein LptA